MLVAVTDHAAPIYCTISALHIWPATLRLCQCSGGLLDCATLVTASSCMQTVRQVLRDHLEKINPDKDWSFITSQIGMFSFTGLTPPQVSYLPTLPQMNWQEMPAERQSVEHTAQQDCTKPG